MTRSRLKCRLLLLLVAVGLPLPGLTLDLEPRRWAHIPLGSNFAGGAVLHTEADIDFNPALRLEDVEMRLDTVAAKYVHGFELFGKSARIDVSQAYQKGRWKGKVDGVRDSITRSGWSDTFVRFAANLHGAPPLKGKAFADYRARTKDENIVGVGLVLRLPTGDYMDDKLINLGQNRYVVRPQLGLLFGRGKWATEITAEISFYGDNDDFFNGKELEQEPLFFSQAHLIRNLGPGEWVSLGVGFDYGGENTVDGDKKDNERKNYAWALSYSYPLSRQSGIKLAYISSRTQESTGSDTDSLALAVLYRW